MYNVAQDTRFCLGGDKETSYMYELGFAPQYHAACEPWATQIKEEAAELFEIISASCESRTPRLRLPDSLPSSAPSSPFLFVAPTPQLMVTGKLVPAVEKKGELIS